MKENQIHKKIIIAIDGHSSCGKSTLARDLASRLDYIYVDSGALYRAVSLYLLENQVNFNNAVSLRSALEHIEIDLLNEKGKQITILNSKDVSLRIRKPDISAIVSEVAALYEVRKFLKVKQKQFGVGKGIVMDGRDIGTVIFPRAELKIFLTADLETRVKRRFKELSTKGVVTTMEEVKSNLLKRDRIDSEREHSPLVMAKDAIMIDNSHLSREDQLIEAMNFVEKENK